LPGKNPSQLTPSGYRVFAHHSRQQARRPDGAMLEHNCAPGHVTAVVGSLCEMPKQWGLASAQRRDVPHC
jgi:hypothetical protein